MVTKRFSIMDMVDTGSVLAKILTVTKQLQFRHTSQPCSVLAKILMVTKPQKYGSTFLNVIEY